MKVIFKQNYYYSRLNKKYTPGQIAEIDDEIAKKMIEFNIVDIYKGEKEEEVIKKVEPEIKCKFVYPGEVAPGNYWLINDDGEAFIKEKVNQDIQKVEVQKDFNFQAVNDKVIKFKKGDIVYLTEGQFMAMKNLGYI